MKYTEKQRLNAVSRFKNLDAGIVKDLNDLVSLTADICDTPVALVTLLEKDEQWFKASVGTEVECTPRSLSFCEGTIRQTELLMIPDLLDHPQHCTNPLVTGWLRVSRQWHGRAYRLP